MAEDSVLRYEEAATILTYRGDSIHSKFYQGLGDYHVYSFRNFVLALLPFNNTNLTEIPGDKRQSCGQDSPVVECLPSMHLGPVTTLRTRKPELIFREDDLQLRL